jgi:4-amino-4-deoxy-L-arabinose transferase-like glycosyltransferase
MNVKNLPEERRETVFWACLLSLIAGYTVWQLFHLGGLRWDWDEGVYLLTARTVAEGHRLYSDIFSMAPPLFIASLNLGFWLGGETVAAGRAVIVLYSALGLLGVGLLAREWGGRLAGPVAVVALAAAPHFYILSRTVIADLPSMGLACLALWMAVRYGRTGRRRWLAAAGWMLSCGLCLKLTAGLVAPAMVLAVLLHDWQAGGRQGRPATARLGNVCYSGAVMGVAFAVPMAICLLTHEVGPMVEQVVALLWTQREHFTPDYGDNAMLLFKYLAADNFNVALNRGLTVLGLAGSLALAWRRPKDALVLGLWLATTVVVIIGYAPLWVHLFSPVLFPLAAGAGVGAGFLYRAFYEIVRDRHSRAARAAGQKAIGIALALALAGYVYDWPAIIAENGRRASAPSGGLEKTVRQIAATTSPGDLVITDEPLLAFVAGRPVPPDLCDCSVVRITVGKLTVRDLINATKRHQPAAIALGAESRFAVYLPGYADWVGAHYQMVWEGEKGSRIYLRK